MYPGGSVLGGRWRMMRLGGLTMLPETPRYRRYLYYRTQIHVYPFTGIHLPTWKWQRGGFTCFVYAKFEILIERTR